MKKGHKKQLHSIRTTTDACCTDISPPYIPGQKTMISDDLYQNYLNMLLGGNRRGCLDIVQTLLKEGIEIKLLYTELFQKSMYQVGELWEHNKISVAREHLATDITEGMLSAVYPSLFTGKQAARKAVITCAANEYHQLGGKMVADFFELHGWDSYFLGANTPIDQLTSFVDEIKPDLVGLSLAVYFNLPAFKVFLDELRSTFPALTILVGGHAFIWGGDDFCKHYPGISYMPSLNELERTILSY